MHNTRIMPRRCYLPPSPDVTCRISFTGPSAAPGAHVTQPEPARAGFSPRRQPSRVPARLLLLLMVIAGTLAAAYAVGRPRLTLHNRLAAPVRVTAGDAAARTIGPGASARIPAPWGKSLLVSWELVRPLSADGVPMGEA